MYANKLLKGPVCACIDGFPGGGINWAFGHLLGKSLAYVSPVLRSVLKVKRSSLGNSKGVVIRVGESLSKKVNRDGISKLNLKYAQRGGRRGLVPGGRPWVE